MESQFRALDIEIQNQPLPAPYADWRCLISCNDCSAKSNVPFHFLGLRCDNCLSYNTSQIRILRPEDGPGANGPGTPGVQRVGSPFGANIAVPAVATLAGLAMERGLGNALDNTPQGTPTGTSNANLTPPQTLTMEERRRSGASSIEIATGLDIDHGDEDLIVDDDGGWVTDSDDGTRESEDDDYDDNESRSTRRHGEDDEDDDDDDDEDELINLIGHL